MSKYRITAYFIHEDEKMAAEEAVKAGHIAEAEWTSGYVMGVVDESRIISLEKQGLVVSVVGQVEASELDGTAASGAVPTTTSNAVRPGARHKHPVRYARSLAAPSIPGTSAGRVSPRTSDIQQTDSKILSVDKRRTQYYVVRFHGPLTEERRNKLRELDTLPLERLTPNQYTVQLKPSQVQPLAENAFVDSVRLYTETDTLRIRNAPHVRDATLDRRTNIRMATGMATARGTIATKAAIKADTRAGAAGDWVARGRAGTGIITTGAEIKLETTVIGLPENIEPSGQAQPTARMQPIRIYTVKLHHAKDMPAVTKWLARKRRKPLWKQGDQLQIALKEDSKTIIDLAKRPEVAVIQQQESPRLFDRPARVLLGLEGRRAKLGLEGAGEVIGVADTGIDTTHPDLANRILGVTAWGRKGDASDPDGHGTHVAGCAVGDGTASGGKVLGAAPQAKLFFQSILDKNGGLGGLPGDAGKLLKEAYANGVRIHNNSWGAYSFAHYSNASHSVDRFVADHPDMLVVIAAGNDGLGIPRGPQDGMNCDEGFIDWYSVADPGAAKNGLTVGASRNSRTTEGYAALTWKDAWPHDYPHPPISRERISSDDQCLAAFSGRGPCDDARIKPDVVAPGTDIAAAKSKDAPLYRFWGAYPNNSHYGFMGGTSMAAPYVAGCAALAREWYRKEAQWETPSAALLKATLINGTQRLTGADAVAPLEGHPNFHQGFGRIDMTNTVPSPASRGLKLVFDDTWKDKTRILRQTGKQMRYRVKAGKRLPLRICLAWTDPKARALQHSLMLIVDNTTRQKWRGNDQVPVFHMVSGGPRDPNNNVQVVRIEDPQLDYYTIAIIATSIEKPQSFALVVTGALLSDLEPLPNPF
jgi:serine protease AprX